jgi:hypothetical protein
MVVENPYTNTPHRHMRIDTILLILRDPGEKPFKNGACRLWRQCYRSIMGYAKRPGTNACARAGQDEDCDRCPGEVSARGIILEPSEDVYQANSLRMIQKAQHMLIADVVARNLDPGRLATARDYSTKPFVELGGGLNLTG